jgi:uncharacterized RDD family membrane protein YckC
MTNDYPSPQQPAPEPAEPAEPPPPVLPVAASPASAWTAPDPETGPAPGVEFAPHGGRLVAYIIDVILIGLFVVVAAIAFGLLSIVVPPLGIPLLILSLILIPLLYFPWLWARGGQTIGMRPFDLYVVRDRDGGPIGWGTAFLRLIGFWIDSLVFYLGFIWILIDKRRRGWHDLIAGTVVIKRPRA